jgi:hypothetical protein
LPFGVTGVLQQQAVHRKAGAQLGQYRAGGVTAQLAAQNSQWYLRRIGFRSLVGAMAQRYVGDFVRDHAGELRFVVRCLDGAAVDVEEPARQGEGVDGAVVHRFELVGVFCPGCFLRQLAAQVIQIAIHARIVPDGQLALGVGGNLGADFHVLLRRKQVPTRLQFGSLGQRGRSKN